MVPDLLRSLSAANLGFWRLYLATFGSPELTLVRFKDSNKLAGESLNLLALAGNSEHCTNKVA